MPSYVILAKFLSHTFRPFGRSLIHITGADDLNYALHNWSGDFANKILYTGPDRPVNTFHLVFLYLHNIPNRSTKPVCHLNRKKLAASSVCNFWLLN